jgi:hypothetical protein
MRSTRYPGVYADDRGGNAVGVHVPRRTWPPGLQARLRLPSPPSKAKGRSAFGPAKGELVVSRITYGEWFARRSARVSPTYSDGSVEPGWVMKVERNRSARCWARRWRDQRRSTMSASIMSEEINAKSMSVAESVVHPRAS